jgi:hypothetical protein
LSRFHPFDDCLRKKLGFAARYVSGYLETLPPKGKVKLQGSHAGFLFMCLKWAGVNLIPQYNISERHIVTAYGRLP